jgi:hypothetical protein
VIAANRAPATLVVYAYAWGQWQAWCAGLGLCSLPATPVAVCAYLAERAEQSASFSSLEVACCAISHQPRRQRAANPILDEAVRRSAAGCAAPWAPHRAAKPARSASMRSAGS